MAVVTVNSENFEKEVIQSKMPVLLDFWANWCGPCRMMAPVVDNIAESMSTTIKVGKVNIDECQELAEKYGIMSIPTFVVLKDGQEVRRTVGIQSKTELMQLVTK